MVPEVIGPELIAVLWQVSVIGGILLGCQIDKLFRR